MRFKLLLSLTFGALVGLASCGRADWKPKTVDLRLAAIFDDPGFEWYKPTTLYQNPSLLRRAGFTSTSDDFNWNREMPWRTGGMDKSTNVATSKFRRMAGEPRTWREPERYFRDGFSYVRWSYPVGTVFGEVIEVDGERTEIGTITFEQVDAEPVFRLYRTFGTLADIKPFIISETFSRGRFRDSHGNGPVIDERGLVHDIELTKEGIAQILERPFRDVTHTVYCDSEEGLKAYAPTTKQRHSIVPVNSERGFFGPTSCVKCHRTAGMEGRLLDPRPSPDKYGAVRGGAFILSVNQR